MSLEKDALLLGAGTKLASRQHDGSLAIDGHESRLLTLLSVAYGRPLNPSVLGLIRKASKHAARGDECLAAMHIALALPALRDPSGSARRLFLADGLMAEGVEPHDIWRAVEFDPTPLDELTKRYNPDELRVPAGSGRPSGRWTSGGDATDAESTAATLARGKLEEQISESIDASAQTEVPEWLRILLDVGSRASGPAVFLTELLHATPAGGEHLEGLVPDRPDLKWELDEGLLTISRVSDGQFVLQAKRGKDGKIRALPPGMRRLLNEHAFINPDLLPSSDPRSSHRDEPELCPEPPRPDAPQGSESSWAYSDFVKSIINQPPTPPKFGYQLSNPFDGGEIVQYDDCQRSSATMVEFKATGYADQLKYEPMKTNIMYEWLGEATRQIEASGGRPVRWYFAERGALEFAREIFSGRGILKRIQLVYLPPPWSKR
jgi:hypothetical protein